MIPELTPNADERSVVRALNSCGVVVVKNHLLKDEVSSLKSEVADVVKNYGSDYPFGKSVKTGPWLKPPSKYPIIHSTFDNEWMRNITDAYLGKNRYREGVFITHDYRSGSEIGRNGYLHFDRTRAFKFLIYLTDCVDARDGPFSCYPCTHVLGKFLREAIPPKTPYDKMKNRLEVDYSALGYSSLNVVPIYGKAGTLTIFDSDIFHMGGHVSDGHERLVLRSHSRKI